MHIDDNRTGCSFWFKKIKILNQRSRENDNFNCKFNSSMSLIHSKIRSYFKFILLKSFFFPFHYVQLVVNYIKTAI